MQFKRREKTLAGLWIMLAFSMQVKIWFVSQHQTQSLQYITFPLGFAGCVIISHVFFFCNDNQSSIITFQAHDLNDTVRAPKTDWHSAHPRHVCLDLKADRSCVSSYFSLGPDAPWYWFDNHHLLRLPLTYSVSDFEYENDAPRYGTFVHVINPEYSAEKSETYHFKKITKGKRRQGALDNKGGDYTIEPIFPPHVLDILMSRAEMRRSICFLPWKCSTPFTLLINHISGMCVSSLLRLPR